MAYRPTRRAPAVAPSPIEASQIQWDLVRDFLARVMPARNRSTEFKIDYYLPLILHAILHSANGVLIPVSMRRKNNCMASVLQLCFPEGHAIWNYIDWYETPNPHG